MLAYPPTPKLVVTEAVPVTPKLFLIVVIPSTTKGPSKETSLKA